jgi:hypothetical protein
VKRPTAIGWSRSTRIVFIATSRPVDRSVQDRTSPMPPTPISGPRR